MQSQPIDTQLLAAAAAPAAKSKRKKAEQPQVEVVASIKGFNLDFTCRGFQFEIGKTYEHEGDVQACASGFHAIEGNPLEVFGYYPPGISRYAQVKQFGQLRRHGDDSKLASATITIDDEIRLPAFIGVAVNWLKAHCSPAEAKHAEGNQSAASSTGYQSAASSTGDRSAASSTGYQSAASSTGYQSAASSTGYQSAASSTGYRSAASSTGNQSAASSTGYQSAASSTGDRSAAMSSGFEGRVMAEKDGCALFLVYRDPNSGDILHPWSGITGRDGIKAGTWYRLALDGTP